VSRALSWPERSWRTICASRLSRPLTQTHFFTLCLPVRVRKLRKVPVRLRLGEEWVKQALGLVRISKNKQNFVNISFKKMGLGPTFYRRDTRCARLSSDQDVAFLQACPAINVRDSFHNSCQDVNPASIFMQVKLVQNCGTKNDEM